MHEMYSLGCALLCAVSHIGIARVTLSRRLGLFDAKEQEPAADDNRAHAGPDRNIYRLPLVYRQRDRSRLALWVSLT